MDTLKLSDLIGQEIAEVRFRYIPETEEYSIQAFNTYIKLAGNNIIDIPIFDNDNYLQLTAENLEYFQECFNGGDAITDDGKKCLVGQKIVDFLFCYRSDKRVYDRSAYIKLSNGYYLTERKFAPIGIYVGIRLLDKRQFLKEKDELADKFRINIRSFLESRPVS